MSQMPLWLVLGVWAELKDTRDRACCPYAPMEGRMKPLESGWIVALFVVALATACADVPTGIEGLCIKLVNVHGVAFGESSASPPDPASVSSEPYLTVTRNTGCLDQGEPADPWMHGESNFLEPGTTLHEIEGVDPTERLAFYDEFMQEWQAMEPVPTTQ